MDELDSLVDLKGKTVWSDVSFSSGETDEDWSVSENSSDSGAAFVDCCVDSIDDEGVSKLPVRALCLLDLLASNTESAQTLLPFSADDESNSDDEAIETMRRSGLRTCASSWGVAQIREEREEGGPLKEAAEEVLSYQKRRPCSVMVAKNDSLYADFVDPEDDERPAPVMPPASTPINKTAMLNRSPSAPDAAAAKKRKLVKADSAGKQFPTPGGSKRSLATAEARSRKRVAVACTAKALPPSKKAEMGAITVKTEKEANRAAKGSKIAKSCGGKKGTQKSGKRCEFCLETFEDNNLLQVHRREHILGTNHFRCTFEGCEKHYATGEGLRLHVRNVHLLAKNWKCLSPGCSRSFVRQSDLRMHIIRMHSDIRPFPCNVVASCSKSFACHSELRRHVLSCHKMPCPKPEKIESKTNCVDKAYIEGLMLKCDS